MGGALSRSQHDSQSEQKRRRTLHPVLLPPPRHSTQVAHTATGKHRYMTYTYSHHGDECAPKLPPPPPRRLKPRFPSPFASPSPKHGGGVERGRYLPHPLRDQPRQHHLLDPRRRGLQGKHNSAPHGLRQLLHGVFSAVEEVPREVVVLVCVSRYNTNCWPSSTRASGGSSR